MSCSPRDGILGSSAVQGFLLTETAEAPALSAQQRFSLTFVCCASPGVLSLAVIVSTTLHGYAPLQKLNTDKCFKDKEGSCLELT